jgi:hypothetical protein
MRASSLMSHRRPITGAVMHPRCNHLRNWRKLAGANERADDVIGMANARAHRTGHRNTIHRIQKTAACGNSVQRCIEVYRCTIFWSRSSCAHNEDKNCTIMLRESSARACIASKRMSRLLTKVEKFISATSYVSLRYPRAIKIVYDTVNKEFEAI